MLNRGCWCGQNSHCGGHCSAHGVTPSSSWVRRRSFEKVGMSWPPVHIISQTSFAVQAQIKRASPNVYGCAAPPSHCLQCELLTPQACWKTAHCPGCHSAGSRLRLPWRIRGTVSTSRCALNPTPLATAPCVCLDYKFRL
jgi:hypothetical protein